MHCEETFACSGKIDQDKDGNPIIQFSGDQRTDTKDLLVEEGISELLCFTFVSCCLLMMCHFVTI